MDRTLVQYDWCPYGKRKRHQEYAPQRKGRSCKDMMGRGLSINKGRGLRRNQPGWHLNLDFWPPEL